MVDLVIILILVLMNGALAATEIAVLSARRPLLAAQAEAGDRPAQSVLSLLENPSAFLSTIQVGITLVGILVGALGGADAVRRLAPVIARLPIAGVEVYSEAIAFALTVAIVTYLTLVVGELAPKRVALQRAESIAKSTARPMRYLALLARPVVWVLSQSTDTVLRLIGVTGAAEPPVTEEEVRYLVTEGARTGVFVPAEKEFVDRIFRFAEERVVHVMRPRADIVALDLDESPDSVKEKLSTSGFSRFPVYRGDLSNIVGIVHAKDLLSQEGPLDLHLLLREALFVPETKSLLSMLQSFQATRSHMAIVLNEFGGTEGLVTLEDVLEEIVGEIRDEYDREEPAILQRADGSLLVDGSLSITDLKQVLKVEKVEGEETHEFHTLGGFLMAQLRRVPQEGDIVDWSGHRFEVVDMDGLRVDKVLIQGSESS